MHKAHWSTGTLHTHSSWSVKPPTAAPLRDAEDHPLSHFGRGCRQLTGLPPWAAPVPSARMESRMSTRRGGERPEKAKDEERPPEKVKKSEDDKEKKDKEREREREDKGSSSSVPAAPNRVPVEPKPKRPKLEHEEGSATSWGGPPPPPPPQLIPQPLLPMAKIAGGGDGDFEDGPCESAKFNGPSGIALASDGSLLIADSNNRRLRKISVSAGSDGSSTVAGGDGSERRSRAGTAGGPVAFDSVTTIVGNGDPGYSDGRGEIAALCDPYGVVCDSHGNVFLTDAASHTVRRVSSSGEITLVAGREGRPGFQEGRGNQAAFEFPCASAAPRPPPPARHGPPPA